MQRRLDHFTEALPNVIFWVEFRLSESLWRNCLNKILIALELVGGVSGFPIIFYLLRDYLKDGIEIR